MMLYPNYYLIMIQCNLGLTEHQFVGNITISKGGNLYSINLRLFRRFNMVPSRLTIFMAFYEVHNIRSCLLNFATLVTRHLRIKKSSDTKTLNNKRDKNVVG